MIFKPTNAFELIVATILSLWIIGFGISFFIKKPGAYWKKTSDLVVGFCKKEWKVVIAILITYLLCATKGTVNISFY